MKHLPLLLCLVLAAQTVPAADATKALHDFFAAEWEDTMQRNPTWASQLGDRRWNDRWEDLTPAAIAAEHKHNQDALARLRQLDRKALSPRDQLNYDLFEHRLTRTIEGHAFRWHLVPLNQRGGLQTDDELADSLRFDTLQDFEDWLARLRAVIRQNVVISLGTVVVLVGFALFGKIPLTLGVLGHEGSTVVVVLNSLRLLLWPRGSQST